MKQFVLFYCRCVFIKKSILTECESVITKFYHSCYNPEHASAAATTTTTTTTNNNNNN